MLRPLCVRVVQVSSMGNDVHSSPRTTGIRGLFTRLVRLRYSHWFFVAPSQARATVLPVGGCFDLPVVLCCMVLLFVSLCQAVDVFLLLCQAVGVCFAVFLVVVSSR